MIGWPFKQLYIISLKPIENLFGCVWDHCLLKCPPLFHLHHPGTVGVILIFTEKAQDCFLFTDRLLLVSWFYMPFCTSLSSCVQYFSPVSFHFIMHNLISEMFCFVFSVCMDYFGCY